MNTLRQFNIPFAGLSHRVHQFEFQIDKKFFQSFDNNNIEDCDILVKLDFDKRETFFHLKFYIDGTVKLPCDRCLELYDQAIFGDYELFVKFSDSPETADDEGDDDVIFISRNEDHLDISKEMYDYILLSIPLRCVHPEDEDGKSACNELVLSKLKQQSSESLDPRWEALNKLRNKN